MNPDDDYGSEEFQFPRQCHCANCTTEGAYERDHNELPENCIYRKVYRS